MALKPSPRFILAQPKMPFRRRALTLALAASTVGVAAFVLALTYKPYKPTLRPRPSATVSVEWPEGFVEWDELMLDSASPPERAPATAPPPSSSRRR